MGGCGVRRNDLVTVERAKMASATGVSPEGLQNSRQRGSPRDHVTEQGQCLGLCERDENASDSVLK